LENWRDILRIFAVLILVVGAIAGLVYANSHFLSSIHAPDEFLVLWEGTHTFVKEGLNPYSKKVGNTVDRELRQDIVDPEIRVRYTSFQYPLFSTLFVIPFALLDYSTAHLAWMTLLELCLIATALISLRLLNWSGSLFTRIVLVLFSILWYYGARDIIVGQLSAVVALLMVLALWFIQQRQDIVAGVLLAFSMVKPQMAFPLLIFASLWAISTNRRDLLLSASTSLGVLVLAFMVLMPNWPLEMLSQWLSSPYLGNPGSALGLLASKLPGIRPQLSFFLHALAIAYLCIEWFLARGRQDRRFLFAALVTLAITQLIILPANTTNMTLMVPVLYAIFQVWKERWKWGGRFLMWLVLLLILAGLWVIFITTSTGIVEPTVLYLITPLIGLLGLWWVRYWFVQPPRVYVEDLVQKVD
jgi:Glycosyltransferase family 87